MLAGAGFGDDAVFAHALGEQRLSERVVYLVRAGVGEVFALDVYLRAAKLGGEVFGEIERRGTADVVAGQRLHFGLKRLVGLGGDVLALKLFYGAHKRFGDKASAEIAKAASLVRQGGCGAGCCCHGDIPDVGLFGLARRTWFI